MKRNLFRLAGVVACLLVFSSFAFSQDSQKKKDGSVAGKTAKAVIVVVGTTAKIAAKTIVVAAPVALKLTSETMSVSGKAIGFAVDKSLPVVKKLIVTYLKAKLPL